MIPIVTLNYSFQIKKCSDPTCCSEPQSCGGTFSSVHWYFQILLKTRWNLFQSTWISHGHETKDTNCPSLSLVREWEQEPSFLFTSAKVRGVANCLACDKLRCLYCEKQSMDVEKFDVNLTIESKWYICCFPICLENHLIFDCIQIHTSTACDHLLSEVIIVTKSWCYPCVHSAENDCSVPQTLGRYKQVF